MFMNHSNIWVIAWTQLCWSCKLFQIRLMTEINLKLLNAIRHLIFCICHLSLVSVLIQYRVHFVDKLNIKKIKKKKPRWVKAPFYFAKVASVQSKISFPTLNYKFKLTKAATFYVSFFTWSFLANFSRKLRFISFPWHSFSPSEQSTNGWAVGLSSGSRGGAVSSATPSCPAARVPTSPHFTECDGTAWKSVT